MAGHPAFESARRRVASGKNHIANLEREIAAYAAQKPYAVVSEPNPERGWADIKVKVTKPLPAAIEDAVFDIFGNLRSALDNATYATCILNGVTSPRDSNFPFGDTDAEVRSRASRSCRHIPTAIFDFCVALKPHKGGDGLLWALNRACNINKHRLLVPAGFATNAIQFMGVVNLMDTVRLPPIWDYTKNESVVFSVVPGTEQDFDLNVVVHITIRDVEFIAGKEAVSTLSLMARVVEGVIDGIEAESRRVGLIA